MVLKNRVALTYLFDKIAEEAPALDFKQVGSDILITDELGGEAQIKRNGNVAQIIGISSVPFSKKYTPEEGNFKKRGFFRGVLESLHEHGIRTIKVRLQSQDSRAALKRLVETGDLINPRDIRGLSIDEYPTTFDIR
jgi:hypothetical protein